MRGSAVAGFTVIGLAPALSKADAVLEERGYLRVTKGYAGKRPRTWLSATDEGRAAFEDHVSALREIASGAASSERAGTR